MSVQFGSWNFGYRPVEEMDLSPVRALLAPYGPDGGGSYHSEGVDIVYYALHETEESQREEQPCRTATKRVLTWDGRLDNRMDLLRELSEAFPASIPDVALVAAAYNRWGPGCLRKLIGDWALSVWDPDERKLVLARDFMGTRPLFYSFDRTRVQWCSVLDPLVLFAGHSFPLNREYLAGWFGLFPASHLTPYVGIHAVPPASCVLVRENSLEVKEFWRFASGKTEVYRNDADYEERFRDLFELAVRRRLRSSSPILAELSGGMDSSSIVCMADRILATQGALTPRLDTVSYYSSVEPSWNELPYVSKVEEQRGRQGFHIEVQAEEAFRFDSESECFMATPGSLHPAGRSEGEFMEVLCTNGNRVLLSGIGGDEVLGGAPCPTPQLADLLAGGRLPTLSKQLISWALALRKPLVSLLFETLAIFLREGSATRSVRPPAWLCPSFLDRHSGALRGYPRRAHLSGPRPSFQENLGTIDAMRRQLSCYPLSARPAYQKLYPYLDRDLLEFLFSIPQDQLLRPHQRRSLMRRALSGIVPEELLNRKRKAFVIRGPLLAISSQYGKLEAMTQEMISSSLDIVHPAALVAALQEARAGGQVVVNLFLRVFAMERWLQNVARWRVLQDLESHAKGRFIANRRPQNIPGPRLNRSLS
jgi:asparagine synthase (glutamine-hydrolysing)